MVVDSSVVVKWFKHEREPRLAAALELLHAHRNEEVLLCAPTLLRLEVLNALRSAQLTGTQLEAVCADLEGLRLVWHEISAELTAAAAAVASTAGLTVYDGLFVALASQLDAELVTDDGQVLSSGACRLRPLGT